MTHQPTRCRFSLSAVVALLALVATFATHARAVTIPTVPVGNAGNAGDTEVMVTDGTSGYGAVAYDYRIGPTEVTNAQYVEFLNAKAATDPLGLYSPLMGSGFGGITQSGSDGSYTYATISGRDQMPVNVVSWYDALRFANWLNNGQGTGDTETGAYTLLGGIPEPSNGVSITRNAGATWFLPSENEWYKAAYHKNDGATGNYWDYPTSSDTAPTAEAPPGGVNSANYGSALGDLTITGAYTNSPSPYGAFDMGGNVWEWNEALLNANSRGLLGGSFVNTSNILRSSYRTFTYPMIDDAGFTSIGFRVATVVPEPSSGVLAIVACGVVWWWRKRFR